MKTPSPLVLQRAAQEIADRRDATSECAQRLVALRRAKADLAPIWSQSLVYTYSQVEEVPYPDLPAHEGMVLPIDTAVDPASIDYEYFQVDRGGLADWIDEQGNVMHSSFLTSQRFTGRHHEIGHGYEWTIFDLERSAMANLPLPKLKQDIARRAHAEKTEWVWMYGDSAKDLKGLATHPNIPRTLAPLNAGATSRLWANKTADEIMADMTLFLDAIPAGSQEMHFATKVLMPPSLIRVLRSRFVAATADGAVSLWDRLQKLYAGDAAGQGKVEFVSMRTLAGASRINPLTGTDTSGLAGDLMIALPPDDVSRAAFIRARPFTTLSPQEDDFSIKTLTHSRIGGAKIVYPRSIAIFEFGVT